MTRSVLLIGNFLSRTMFTPNISEQVSLHLEKQGWRVRRTSSRKNGILRGLAMLANTLRWRKEYSLACIEVYSGRAFLWAEACASALVQLKKPLVLALHGGGLARLKAQQPRRMQRLTGKAAAIASPSRFLLQAFENCGPSLHYLPNSIELFKYPFRLRGEAQPRLIWLRAFEQKTYNPQMAAQAVELLKVKFPGLQLTMIGPDKGDGSMQEVQRFLQEHQLDSRCRIIPGIPKEQVAAYLSQADIFLNTTNLESFGVAVMEAAACGLCIVSTNVGELPYLWADGEDALLVAPGDAAGMAVAVERILREPRLAARLSEQAHRKAEGFDAQAILPLWEKLFEEIIE